MESPPSCKALRLTQMKKQARQPNSDDHLSAEQNPKCGPGRPNGSTKQRAAESKKEKLVFELSITVSLGGQDIDPTLIYEIQKFLAAECIAGKCSLERGGAAYHLHLQMVIRIQAKSVQAVSKLVKVYLGWDCFQPPGATVMCRKLTNRGMHTFQGMFAYCMKDADEAHYATVDHNILPGDLQQGLELSALRGKEENKTKIALTMTNYVDEVSRWRRFNCKHPLIVDFERDLYEMIKTGKYYPAPSWVVGEYGIGYEPYRMQSLYKIMVDPSTVSRADVANVFHLPEAFRQDHDPRRVWFAERFQNISPEHSSEKETVERVDFQSVQDAEKEEASKGTFTTVEKPDFSEVLPRPNRNKQSEEVQEIFGDEEAELNKANSKGKSKMVFPTRHMWPPE